MIHVTRHAAERYCERVAPHVSTEQAISSIREHEIAILRAANFGCRMIKLGTGVRLVLDGTSVITVYRPEKKQRGHA